MTIATSLVTISVVLAAVAPVRAQTAAEAETLFREGKRLMKNDEIAAACEKFEASDRLEPTVGTELNLADCREKNGQLASAWAMFVKAAATAKHADNDGKREAEARRRAAALESKLVYLTIVVPDDNRVDGLVLERNKTAIDPGLWNQRVPIDPGDYEITASAPGYEPWTATVAIKTKSKKLEMPALDEAKPEKHRKQTATPVAVRETTEREAPHRSGARTASVVIGVAGLVGVGLGIGFGLHATSVERDADAICPGTSCTDAHAVDLNKSARTDALIANIGFVAGGVALAGAVTLWLVGSPSHRDRAVSLQPIVGRESAGFAVGGRF